MARDVALSKGGTLTGQLLDSQGAALASVKVSIRQLQREIASTLSDQDGYFSLSGLRGGTYQVVAGQAQGLFRLWAPNTAPPSARSKLLLVSSQQAVRGLYIQDSWDWMLEKWDGLTMLGKGLVIGGIATAIAVPIAVHNSDDDDDPVPVSP